MGPLARAVAGGVKRKAGFVYVPQLLPPSRAPLSPPLSLQQLLPPSRAPLSPPLPSPAPPPRSC